MANYIIQDTTLIAIADSIRAKTGRTEPILPSDMPTAIESITGGGSGEGLVTVTFMNGTDELLSRPVYIGDDCPDPVTQERIETPTKESTVDKVYTYNGWTSADGGSADDTVLANIAEDKILYAAFSSAVREYTITWLDDDGTVLKTEQVAYGIVPNYTPSKDGYVFVEWSNMPVAVESDASYTAVWRERIALKDHTWEQLEAMSIDEMREKFVIGEEGPNMGASYYKTVLIGFEHDDLADGTGKARMTFAGGGSLVPSSYVWGDGKDWSDCYPRIHCDTHVSNYYTVIVPYAKTVIKKYVAKDGTVKDVEDKYFAPSLSELGYIDAPNEGAMYEIFTEKAMTEKLPGFQLLYAYYGGLGFVRTIDSATGQVYAIKQQGTPALYGTSNKYTPYITFCI